MFQFPVSWLGDRLPWGLDILDELTHLVVDLDARSLSVADIDETISVHDETISVHGQVSLSRLVRTRRAQEVLPRIAISGGFYSFGANCCCQCFAFASQAESI